MELIIDGRTMAVSWPSGVPVTDMRLVLGDTVPVRIRVDHALANCTPALAVKQAIGSSDLIMTVTEFTREDDWKTASWVINTVPLQETLGNADKVDLVAEVVLVAPDGAQHTSRPIRVTVRRDILPAEYAPPAEVLADWHDLINAALAAQLPDALHDAGMYVTPAGGSTTLASDMSITHRRDVTYYRLPLDHHNIVGHLASTYTINSVTLKANVSSTPVHIEVYKLANGSYRLLGRSLEAITVSNANYDNTWTYPPGLEVRHDDTIILRLVTADGTDAVLALAITQVLASTPESGADIVDGLVDPQRIINPAYPDIRYLLYVRLGVSYTSGVSVGGVELATKDHFDALSQEVVSTGEQVHQDAQSVQDIAEGLTIKVGTVTTGSPGSQATASLKPGSTVGSYTLDMIIPRGDVGVPGADADLVVTDKRYGQLAAANSWGGSQSYHGLVDYYRPVTMWDSLEVQGDLYCAGNISGTFTGNFSGTVTGTITPQPRLDFAAKLGGQTKYYLACVADGQMLSLYATGGSSPTLVLRATRGGISIPGTLDVSGTINANGGINIPLAAFPATDTAAVNRLYAAGMAGVTSIYTQHTYLRTDGITATGSARTTVFIPGQYAQTVIPANTHSTVKCSYIGPEGQWNYSNFAGFSVPWQLTSAGKFTVGFGRGNKTTRQDLTLDSYSIIPDNNLEYNLGEILDITFDNIRDTTRNGYEIRVREIYAAESTRKWMVKTTTSFIPASHNEPIPWSVNKIIYQQYASFSNAGDSTGALYLLTCGGQVQQLWKIATVRGVATFEVGVGFFGFVTDVPGIPEGNVSLYVGSGERTNYQPGNVNPVYYGLEALARNVIQSESTAEFVDINTPIK